MVSMAASPDAAGVVFADYPGEGSSRTIPLADKCPDLPKCSLSGAVRTQRRAVLSFCLRPTADPSLTYHVPSR
jgi:hypothetical protein